MRISKKLGGNLKSNISSHNVFFLFPKYPAFFSKKPSKNFFDGFLKVGNILTIGAALQKIFVPTVHLV